MRQTRSARRRRTPLGAAVVALATVLLLVMSSLSAGAAPPPPGPAPTDPTDQQLQSAADNQAQVAELVGQYNGKVAAAQIQLQQLQGKLELAEQKVALTHSQALLATAAATAARKRVVQAGAKVDEAHAAFITEVQDRYYGGGVDGTVGGLLTAQDPSQVLQINALEQYQAQSKSDAVGRLQVAEVAKSNADAAARLLAAKATKAAVAAQVASDAAENEVTSQAATKANLESTLAQYQDASAAATSRLANLQSQRTSFNAWHAQFLAYQAYRKEQARIAAEKAREARLAAIAKAQAEARARAAQNSGGGTSTGGDSNSSGPIASGPAAPTGSWTPAKGRKAVARARAELGVIYAWAGGNQYGPTRGVCAGDGAWNDCNVIGFDCSGLAMYAWGQGWDHYAATQYTEAGSYHPSLDDLVPGDLLFWSNDGTIGGIHHVAIYIGNGQIIQAPESGEVIEVSSMYAPGGIFGATRPLT